MAVGLLRILHPAMLGKSLDKIGEVTSLVWSLWLNILSCNQFDEIAIAYMTEWNFIHENL